jgi:hypothetical protein
LLRVAGAAPDPSPAPQWGQGRGPALVAAAVSLPRTAVLGKKVRVAGVVATKHHIIVAYAQEEGKGVVIWCAPFPPPLPSITSPHILTLHFL